MVYNRKLLAPAIYQLPLMTVTYVHSTDLEIVHGLTVYISGNVGVGARRHADRVSSRIVLYS